MIPRQADSSFHQLCTSRTRAHHFYLLSYQANKQLVMQTKYNLNLNTVNQISQCLTNTLPTELYDKFPIETDWSITSVPQYWLTRLQRRFDVNEIIVNKLAKRCGWRKIKVLKNSSRVTQGKCKTKSARIANAKHKFRLRRNKTCPRNVILFDDVVATGSTMQTCEKLLRSVGAKNVVWVSIAH